MADFGPAPTPESTSSSTMVFHSPQDSQRPCQRADRATGLADEGGFRLGHTRSSAEIGSADQLDAQEQNENISRQVDRRTGGAGRRAPKSAAGLRAANRSKGKRSAKV